MDDGTYVMMVDDDHASYLSPRSGVAQWWQRVTFAVGSPNVNVKVAGSNPVPGVICFSRAQRLTSNFHIILDYFAPAISYCTYSIHLYAVIGLD